MECWHPLAGGTAQQSSGGSELAASDLAAADDFVNELASSEAPGCRLPMLRQLLQGPETPDAVKACQQLTLSRICVQHHTMPQAHVLCSIGPAVGLLTHIHHLLRSRWYASEALGASWC